MSIDGIQALNVSQSVNWVLRGVIVVICGGHVN
jgi:hypothetical protein